MSLRDYYENQETSILDLCDDYLLLKVINIAYKMDIVSLLKEGKTNEDLAKEQGWQADVLELVLDVMLKAGYLKKDLAGKYIASARALQSMTKDSAWRLDYLFQDDLREGEMDHKIRCALLGESYSDFKEPDWNAERLRVIGVHSVMLHFWEAIDSCELSSCKKLLDVGGGHGYYSIAWAEKYPQLQAAVFDLPSVMPLTKKNIAEFDLEDRMEALPGNFMTDMLPEGYDVMFCSNILHFDKRDTVLKKVYAALPAGGRIIIRNRVLDGEESLRTAIEKLEWKLNTDSQLHEISWWQDMLRKNGFKNVETLSLSGFFAVIAAEK